MAAAPRSARRSAGPIRLARGAGNLSISNLYHRYLQLIEWSQVPVATSLPAILK
jgi:hypothetical protein